MGQILRDVRGKHLMEDECVERTEVQSMVDLAIAKYHAENVSRLIRIEDRIIGIDGNGTGKRGAIQILGEQISEVNRNVETLLDKDQQTQGAHKLKAKWNGWM